MYKQAVTLLMNGTCAALSVDEVPVRVTTPQLNITTAVSFAMYLENQTIFTPGAGNMSLKLPR